MRFGFNYQHSQHLSYFMITESWNLNNTQHVSNQRKKQIFQVKLLTCDFLNELRRVKHKRFHRRLQISLASSRARHCHARTVRHLVATWPRDQAAFRRRLGTIVIHASPRTKRFLEGEWIFKGTVRLSAMCDCRSEDREEAPITRLDAVTVND